MAKKVANLFVSLGMNTASFKRDTQKASKVYKKFERKLIRSTKKMRRSINRMGKSMAKMAGAAVLAAGTIGIGAITMASFKSADQLAKTADKLGITTEKLAGLQHAANLTGVSTTTMDMALQRMVRRLSEASHGTGEAVKAIKELNLDAKQLSSISPDKAFAKIAKAMEGTATQADKVRLAMKFFDSEGVALVNTLALGAKGLNGMSKEALDLGIAIDRISASKIESANNSVTRAKSAFKGLGNVIATKLAPFVDAISTAFVNAAKESKGFKNEVNNSVDSIVNAIGFIADSAAGLKVVWKGVGVAFAGIANIFMKGLNAIGEAQLSFIRLFNKDYEKPAFLRVISSAARDAEERLNILSGELDTIVNKTLPSDNIKKWVEEVTVSAQRAAEKVAKSKAIITGSIDSSPTIDAESIRAAARTSLKLEALDKSLMTEREREQESFLISSFMVEEAFQNERVALIKRNDLIEALETAHAKKLSKINKDESDKRTKVLTGQLGAAASIFSSIGGLMSKEGKKQSAFQKDLARASIIASTAQAVMNALAVPPYPLGATLAVAAGLKGAEQLSKVGGGGGGIGSTSIGGLSQTSTGVDQGFPTTQQPATQPGGITQIIFNGDMLGEDLSERLIEIIKTAVNDQDVVLFDSDSRQVQDIREAS